MHLTAEDVHLRLFNQKTCKFICSAAPSASAPISEKWAWWPISESAYARVACTLSIFSLPDRICLKNSSVLFYTKEICAVQRKAFAFTKWRVDLLFDLQCPSQISGPSRKGLWQTNRIPVRYQMGHHIFRCEIDPTASGLKKKESSTRSHRDTVLPVNRSDEGVCIKQGHFVVTLAQSGVSSDRHNTCYQTLILYDIWIRQGGFLEWVSEKLNWSCHLPSMQVWFFRALQPQGLFEPGIILILDGHFFSLFSFDLLTLSNFKSSKFKNDA